MVDLMAKLLHIGMIVALVVLLAGTVLAQGHYIGELIDVRGNAIANAQILICTEPAVGLPCSPQATVYSDVAQTQQLPMPFVGDQNGNFDFYAPCAVGYHFQISAATIQTFDVPYVFLPCQVGASGVPINTLLAATGSNTINNGSFDQNWNWSLSGTNSTVGLGISENAPSSNTGQFSVLMGVNTRTGSTIPPFEALAHNGTAGLQITTNGDIRAMGTGTFIGPVRIPGLTSQVSLATDPAGNIVGGTATGGGIQSINGDTTPAQRIVGTGIEVFTSQGTTNIIQTQQPLLSINNDTTANQKIIAGTGIQITQPASGTTQITNTGLGGTATPFNLLTSATGSNDEYNGNTTQAWRWTLTGTTPEDGLFISEGSSVSSNTGLNTAIVGIGTRAGSTVAPFRAIAHDAPGLMVDSAGNVDAVAGATFIGPVQVSNITGSTQCVQASNNGTLSGTGFPCPPGTQTTVFNAASGTSGTFAMWQTPQTCSTIANISYNVCTSTFNIPGNPFRTSFLVVCSAGAIGGGSPHLVEAGPQAVNPTNQILIGVMNGTANGSSASFYQFLTCYAFGT